MNDADNAQPRPWRRWLFLLVPALALAATVGAVVVDGRDSTNEAGAAPHDHPAPSADPAAVDDPEYDEEQEQESSGGPEAGHDEHVVVAATGADRTTARSGPWNSPDTWAEGSVPQPGDRVAVAAGHDVALDGDVAVDGLQIAGTLTAEPDRPVTIDSTGSVLVTGRLTMGSPDPAVQHTLRFVGVDEARFGGALDGDTASDVGLWVLEAGQLDLQGARRTGWTTVEGSIPAGATTIEVRDAAGWRVGDELAISPTDPPTEYTNPETTYLGFHETTIADIDGDRVTLSEPTTRAHDQVDGRWTAEVMNLTRNVVVEGTDSGSAHVLVQTTGGPQTIRYAALRHLGVEGSVGRYPLHFHHAGDSSRGSLVEGVVVRDGGHHAFVPHMSHGITMRDVVAYDIGGGDAYWWDQGDLTNDLFIEHAIAARTTDSGFFLGMGWNMTLRDSVAVGLGNRDGNVAGYEWENGANGLWVFEDAIAHNNDNRGIRVWQNSANPQVIDGYVAFHNTGPGIEHGAYTNRYLYRDIELYGNRDGGIILQAVSRASEDDLVEVPGVTFQDMVIDTAGVSIEPHLLVQHSAIPAAQPVVLRNTTFRGATDQPLFHFLESSQHQLRCIDCEVDPDAELIRFSLPLAPEDTWLEMVGGGDARRYRPLDIDDGAEQVASSPALWSAPVTSTVIAGTGNGTGLKVEYFDDPELRQLRHTTLLTYPLEYYWTEFGTPYPSVDTTDGAGVRLTGQLEVEPGQSGTYGFTTLSSGGVRLWVDGVAVIDDPRAEGGDAQTGTIELEGGRRHDLRMEVYDWEGGTDYFTFGVAWTRPDGRSEVLPTSQLHPAPGVPGGAPPVAVSTR